MTQQRPPLGLPPGSVRALLTLLVVGFIVAQTVRGVALRLLWVETLMIALAHYFTSRRFVELSDELREKLEADGTIEPDEQPLYLPKHSVRFLIIATFIGLGVYLGMHGRLLEHQAIAILGTVGAYFLGILFRHIVAWWSRGNQRPAPGWWVHGKALATIAVVSVTLIVNLLDLGGRLPFGLQPDHLANLTLGLVLFYFGSR